MKSDIDAATRLIFDYMNSNYTTIDMFCENRNIDSSKFLEYLSLVKIYTPNIYSEYEVRIKDKEEKQNDIRKREIQKVINYIKTGVEVRHNKYRPFEYLDFCIVCDLSIKEFYDLCDQYDLIKIDNMKAIKEFIEKNGIHKRINKKKILDEKYVVIMNGSEKEITELEKLQILSIMKDLKLPMELKIYKQLCRRYFSGNFCLDNIEKFSNIK